MNRSPLLVRPRLLRKLTSALRQGHVLITAPPGYGKTTLLRALAANTPDTHFLVLTPADLDLGQLQTRLQPLWRANAVIVLDDVHHLEPSDEAVAWLAEQLLQPSAHCVLSGRQMPAGLENLAPRVGVTRLTAKDLAFKLAETQALLAGRLSSAADWHQQTNGWPLALALLGQQADRAARAPGLPANLIFDYLAETLVRGLPPHLLTFMQGTSLPLRFNDELAAAVLNVTEAQAGELRAEVLRRNLFLEAAEAPGWFRYHDLIRSFLLARLKQAGEDPARRFGQIADWFEAQDDRPMAIEHALAGQLGERAAQLLERLPLEYVWSGGRVQTFRRWVMSLDEVARAAHPDLLKRLGRDLIRVGQRDEGWTHLRESLRLAEANGDRALSRSVRLNMANAFTREGQFDQALSACEAILAEPALPPAFQMDVLFVAGNACALTQQLRRARAAYEAALVIAETIGDTFAPVHLRNNLAELVYLPSGEFELAEAALRANEGYFADKPAMRVTHLFAWATLHDFEGDWEGLERDVAEAAGLQQQTEQAKPSDAFWVAYYRALLAIRRGEWTDAQLALVQAEAYGEDQGDRLICAAYARGWLLRRQGLFQPAIEWVNETLAHDWDLPPYRALLALERELAITFSDRGAGNRQALAPELLSFIRLRARPGLVYLHALLAVRCQQDGDARWQRHARAVLRAHDRPGYARLLTRRDPDLGAQFWTLCLREGLASRLASGALAEIGTITTILPVLQHHDPGARSRAAQALAAVGREEAMPALAAAVEAEKDHAVAQALEAALDALEHSAPPILRVQLMGAFVVWRGDRLIRPEDWQRPGVRRLFQYLALHRGQRLARDRILLDLWGDTDPASARASFKQMFSWLRRTLEPYMRPRGPSRYISVDEDIYCFGARPEICSIDWEAFQSAVGPALAEVEQQDVLALPDSLLKGLARWQPLLPDIPYEAWTLEPREKALKLYVEGCLYAAQALLGLDRAAEAAAWAEKAVESGPWLEEGYQALMRAQARQGHRSLALKTYAAAVSAIQNELGLAPAPLTEWLAKRLRSGEDI